MNPRVILLLSADATVEAVAREAALKHRHGLRVAHDAREAMRIIQDGTGDVDLVFVDMAAEMHAAAMFEAIGACGGEAPVVALTEHEVAYMSPLVAARGAVECLGKPVSAARFEEIVARFCASPVL